MALNSSIAVRINPSPPGASACWYLAFLFIFLFPQKDLQAQIIGFSPPDTLLSSSIDSLRDELQHLKHERDALGNQVSDLNARMRSLENLLERRLDRLFDYQDSLVSDIDTLESKMLTDEPLRAANSNIMYLSRRQDSLLVYIEHLEATIGKLPEKQYWGIRNNFKEFDHLLLFTFLGAMMSLGVILLIRTNMNNNNAQAQGMEGEVESEADRLSIALTLLVGSVLVILFVIFIL